MAAAAVWRDNPDPVPGAPQLGAHALVGQEQGVEAPVAMTPPLEVAARGSSLLAFVAGYRSNDAGPLDSVGNRWQPLDAAVYRDYDGRFDVRGYVVERAHGGPDVRIRVDKPGRTDGELTLVALEARNAGRLEDVAFAYPYPALRQSSATVTTLGPALLVTLWFGDGSMLEHRVMPGWGFRTVDRFTMLPPNSAVQAAVAVREVDRAGTWQAHWYALPRQGAAIWLLAFSRSEQ